MRVEATNLYEERVALGAEFCLSHVPNPEKNYREMDNDMHVNEVRVLQRRVCARCADACARTRVRAAERQYLRSCVF